MNHPAKKIMKDQSLNSNNFGETKVTNARKPSFDEYYDWFQEKFSVDLREAKHSRLFNVGLNAAYVSINDHEFFSELPEILKKWSNKYQSSCNSNLLMSALQEVQFHKKSFESVVNKSYRINIRNNPKWPEEPEDGWVTPDNWFEEINDIIRTRIVCKFIDVPRIICEHMEEFAKEKSIKSYFKTHQREGGYYAYHFYVNLPVEILVGADVRAAYLWVEIQLATQLQEILYDLTHEIYEDLRISSETEGQAWQWDYTSKRFMPSYMGHTLHMLEAIILDVRNKQIKDENAE